MTWQQIRAFEEEQQMAYITTTERIGRNMGLAEGRTEGRTAGLREAIAMTLTARFGAASESLLPALQQGHNADTLHTLFNRILGVATLDDMRAALDEAGRATA